MGKGVDVKCSGSEVEVECIRVSASLMNYWGGEFMY